MSMGDGTGRSQSAHARPSRRWGSSLALAVLVAPSLGVAMTGCGNPQDRVVVVVRDRETKEPVQDARIEFQGRYALIRPVYRGTTDRHGVARMKVDFDYVMVRMRVDYEGELQGKGISSWDIMDGPTPFTTGNDPRPITPARVEFSVYRDPDFPPSAAWRREVAERDRARQ